MWLPFLVYTVISSLSVKIYKDFFKDFDRCWKLKPLQYFETGNNDKNIMSIYIMCF